MKDVRSFVSKEVYSQFGESSWQFVSDNIVRLTSFIESFFTNYYKSKDLTIEKVEVMINNWASGGQFNNRGLRTVKYITDQIAKGIKTAMLSQHVGGSTNAIDFNIVITFKGGRILIVNSNEIWDIIKAHETEFMAAGLTTLEDKSITQGWTHADCRFTGLAHLLIVKP